MARRRNVQPAQPTPLPTHAEPSKSRWEWLKQTPAYIGLALSITSLYVSLKNQETTEKDTYLLRREALIQQIVANKQQIKYLNFKAEFLERDFESLGVQGKLPKEVVTEAVTALKTFRTKPEPAWRTYKESDIAGLDFNPQNVNRIRELQRMEQAFSLTAEYRSAEDLFKTYEKVIEKVEGIARK